MFDPYIDILDKRVSELILDAGVKEIDSELKSDSTNPVQNKIVKAAIDDLTDDVDAVNGRLNDLNSGFSDLKEDFINNKKGILNPFDMVENSYVATDGTFSPYNGWKRTAYTYIGDCISLVAKTSASSRYNCFYDAEKTKIKLFSVETSDTIIEVPKNATYVIFSNTNAGMDDLTVSFVTKEHDDLSNLKNKIHNLLYLNIDETQFVTGYINNIGGITRHDAYKTSLYIPCAMKRIKFNALTKDIISIAFYSDTEGTLVGSYTNTTALSDHPTHEMDVPNGTKYIRIAKLWTSSFVDSEVPYVCSTETWEALSERIDDLSQNSTETWEALSERIDDLSQNENVYSEAYTDFNLIDASKITLHSYIRNDNGEVKTITNTESANYNDCVSDYIEVVPGKTLCLSGDNVIYGQLFGWYDSQKQYLGGKDTYGAMNYSLHVANVVVPASAAYLRITFPTESDAETAWADYTGAPPTEQQIFASNSSHVDYHHYPTNPCDYNGEEISVFNKIVCIGDSITSGYFNAASNSQSIAKYAYPAFLQKITGVETTNKGDAGETSVSWWTAYSSDDFSGYDCAIINLGINDVLFSVAEADTRSAFASIISALKTANTGIKIFIANINPAYSRGNTTYDAINEVIEDIATSTTDCYFIDLTQYGHTVGIAYAKGHLTACGYLRLAQDYKAAISWIIKNDPAGFRYVQFIGTDLQP
jgi:lysophospholipase L1-like esterase